MANLSIIEDQGLRNVFSNFALSNEEDNTLATLNKEGIADLHFFKTLLPIHRKS